MLKNISFLVILFWFGVHQVMGGGGVNLFRRSQWETPPKQQLFCSQNMKSVQEQPMNSKVPHLVKCFESQVVLISVYNVMKCLVLEEKPQQFFFQLKCCSAATRCSSLTHCPINRHNWEVECNI